MGVIRVIYVEDDCDFGRLTKISLDRAGFLVEVVADPEEAWNRFRQQRPELLLVDLDLGGLAHGLNLIERIASQEKHFPMIVYSSHTDPETVIRTIELGVMDHIDKSTDRQVLIAKLKNIVRRKYDNEADRLPVYELSRHTTYNATTGVLSICGKCCNLKGKDNRLMQLLCLHFNEWVSPRELSFGLWGYEKNIDLLKRYIRHLRTELSEDPLLRIENKHGGYYKLQGE